jgi:hypothetical protein
MELTAENVDKVMLASLFDVESGEPQDEMLARAIRVESIIGQTYGFDPKRIEPQKRNIASMLSQLPDDFMHDKGGGMSFLNACVRQDGLQWADLHLTMNALFMLGEAVGLAKCLVPRELWKAFPGGMPYFVVTIPPELLVNEKGGVEDGAPV